MSKDLLKSRPMTITKGLADNSVMRCRTSLSYRIAMSAAVVDPVGRNANWSVKERGEEGREWQDIETARR